MIIIHHLGISQSERIVWLCEELGLPYRLRRYARDPVTRLAPPAYAALAPSGAAPVVEADGRVLAESGAIVEYLARVHGAGALLVPPGDPAYADFLFWFHFANGSLVPAAMFDSLAARCQGDALAQALGARLGRAYNLLEARLAVSPFLAGAAFSAADLMNLFPLTTMRLFSPRSLAPYPHLRAYLSRITARPAYRRAMEQAEPGLSIALD